MSYQPCEEPRCSEGNGAIELLIRPGLKDLGDFSVRRALPSRERQRVGPFVFFDHMGPASFVSGQGLSVRPHPHIGLATVTYLFEGTIRHRDSLGFDQEIRPGAVNWMTAGRGIVHSERTPSALLESGSRLSGFQVWVALPTELEEVEPSFVHHPAESIPEISIGKGSFRLVAGTAYGARSPVAVASPMFYLAGEAPTGADLELSSEHAQRAVYVAEGEVVLETTALSAGSLAVLRPDCEPTLQVRSDAKIAFFGGAPLPGERHVWWNFVSSRKERIEQAKADWRAGRFDAVSGDSEFIPLPDR